MSNIILKPAYIFPEANNVILTREYLDNFNPNKRMSKTSLSKLKIGEVMDIWMMGDNEYRRFNICEECGKLHSRTFEGCQSDTEFFKFYYSPVTVYLYSVPSNLISPVILDEVIKPVKASKKAPKKLEVRYIDKKKQSLIAQSENHDCTVVAAAYAFDTDYNTAYEMMASIGRRKDRGLYSWQLDKMLDGEFFGRKVVEVYKLNCRMTSKTLAVVAAEFTEGHFYVLVKGHAISLVDGIVYDFKRGAKRRVEKVYQILF